jgi:hypothetical protein
MNPITEARRLLGENGENWCRGQWETPDGRLCLSGAIRRAAGARHGAPSVAFTDPRQEHAFDEATELIMTATRALTDWHVGGYIAINDDPRHSWADIDLILKHAEKAWDESHH